MTHSSKIGFNRRVELEWVEYTANLVLAGLDKDAIHRELNSMLSTKLSIGSEAVRGSREKTITILTRIWADVSVPLKPMRDAGLTYLRTVRAEERLPVHWGMTVTAYPFWGVVADMVGRLLRLQESVGIAQVQRRVTEKLGERETVLRSTRYVIHAFVDWGILEKANETGMYCQGKTWLISDLVLLAFVIEAQLRSLGKSSARLDTVLQSPALFPFLFPDHFDFRQISSPRVTVASHNVGETLVSLR